MYFLDNEINQKVVRRVFQHLGYTLSIANNGMEALTSIDQHGMPDLILMDIQMYENERGREKRGRREGDVTLEFRPIMDGVQTTKIIRKKYPNTWVYIVSMTANAFPGIYLLLICKL